MHKNTVSFVNADFQAKMAEIVFESFLNNEEKEIFQTCKKPSFNNQQKK